LIMRVLAALFYLPSSAYLLFLGNAASALLRPDALSPLLNRPVFAAHNTRGYEHPLVGGLAPSGRCKAGLIR
jgi:hypothetical protein